MRFGGLIAAILFAAVAAVVVLRMSASEQEVVTTTSTIPAAQEVKSASIYVASQPIPIGATIRQEMVTQQPWPEHLLLDGFIRADAGTNIVGMVARAAFQVQEPLLSTKLANPNDPNFIAGALPKGMRVLTLQMNEIEGVAGFVFPGDRVDVMLTHQISRIVAAPTAASDPNALPIEKEEPVTETVLTNALVLAVDQRAASSNTTDQNGNLIIPRSVSLMVTPADAQRLRLGAQKGTLTLALRSLQDKDASDPLITTTVADVSAVAGGSSIASGGGAVMVIRGVEASESTSIAPAPSEAEPPPTQAAQPLPAQAVSNFSVPKTVSGIVTTPTIPPSQ